MHCSDFFNKNQSASRNRVGKIFMKYRDYRFQTVCVVTRLKAPFTSNTQKESIDFKINHVHLMFKCSLDLLVMAFLKTWSRFKISKFLLFSTGSNANVYSSDVYTLDAVVCNALRQHSLSTKLYLQSISQVITVNVDESQMRSHSSSTDRNTTEDCDIVCCLGSQLSSLRSLWVTHIKLTLFLYLSLEILRRIL